MAALQSRRGSVEVEAPQEETAIALVEQMADFWLPGQSLERFSTAIKAPVMPLPVLTRLGQPAFPSEDLASLLRPAYEAISNSAITAAFAKTEAGTNEAGD